MKTIIKHVTAALGTLLILTFVPVSLSAGEEGSSHLRQDTTKYMTFTGKIVDNQTKKPIPFASIYKQGTNIGTVSNIEGDFIFKIKGTSKSGNIGVSHIGYKDYFIPLSELKQDGNIIEIVASPIPIKEVVIRIKDPEELLRAAIANIPDNYSIKPMMVTSFYRETIKQNRHYVGVSEAILDVYKAPYNHNIDFDRVKIFKGRKSMDVKKMDTVIVKLQGGPKTSFLLDVVKNPYSLLDDEFMNYYNYEYVGMIEIDDRLTYVIEFDQKSGVEYPLYKGKIYIDEKNLAIASFEFSLSEKGLNKAVSELVKKRPASMKIDILGSNYLVNYRQIDEKWYFNYVRSELMFKCKWERKLFRSHYTTTMEMAVTDRSIENIIKYKAREAVQMSDIFMDQAAYFSDGDFWGRYNTIKPDESIEAAIARMNSKYLKSIKKD